MRYRRLLVWFRRDLRLHDNPALHAACSDADEIVPVAFVSSLDNGSEASGAREVFRLGSVACLDGELRRRGGYLVLLDGDAAEGLPALLHSARAQGMYHERSWDPEARTTDQRVARAVREAGGVVCEFPGRTVHEPDALRTGAGRPFTVFTPFYRAWSALPIEPPLPPPATLRCAEGLGRVRFANGQVIASFAPGEPAGRTALNAFVEQRLASYARKRDMLAVDGTSRLSPHLAAGTISAREVVWTVQRAMESMGEGDRESARVFISEIAWRDFFYHVLYHYPGAVERSFRPELSDIAWVNDAAMLSAWQEGRTGYPVVDAAMRQLLAEGWMHNRARMVTASFLTKDLLIDWRQGERWFMRQLIDGDVASNTGGWQWSAGTGTDAQPYFRVFNPVTQGRRFDPDGAYVRRFVPELARVPAHAIHEPWRMTAAEQSVAACRIGRDYPEPIVDHARQRLEAVRVYREAAGRYRGGA